MSFIVEFTPYAREQFVSAITYIYRDNPEAAIAYRNKVEKVLRRLEEYPQSGRLIPEFPDSPFREVIVTPYRFFYRVTDTTVWIIAAWHSAQLPELPPNQRW